MKTFRQYIAESLRGEMLIGWLDPKDKLYLYPNDSSKNKYHAQIVTRILSDEEIKDRMGSEIKNQTLQDMEQFVDSGDMTQKQLDDIINSSYMSVIKRLRTGKIDGHYEFEESLLRDGWVKIRIDRRKMSAFSSILSNGNKKMNHTAAKILDKKLGGWPNIASGKMIIDGESDKIGDSKTWDIYVKTGRIPKRTNIGRTMAQFMEENLHERAETIKGWINPKTGKTRFTKRTRPYHVEFIAQTPGFFGVKEKDMLDALEKLMDGWDSPDPAGDAKKELELLKTAKVDINYAIERLAMENGWYRVVGGEYGEISGIKVDDRTVGKILNIMEDKNVIGFGGAGTKEFIIYEYKKPNRDGTVDSDIVKVIPRASAARLMSGKPIGDKMSDIGRTMAMFR
jgi:hypothetical protein